jgi:hypothetical protein
MVLFITELITLKIQQEGSKRTLFLCEIFYKIFCDISKDMIYLLHEKHTPNSNRQTK